MPSVDVRGLNVCRGISFGTLFDAYTATRSSTLFFLGDYGADTFIAKV